LPRSARAQAQVAPVRLVYIFLPNGLDMGTFRPAVSGPTYELPPMLAGLTPLKPHFSVVTGLENLNANPDGPGDHAAGVSGFLTCAKANKSETDIRLGVSADQLAAQKFGKLTRLPSMELGIDGGGGTGNCDSGYSCAYARNIAWADGSTPLPKIVEPQQAFDQLFQGYDPNASEAEAKKRMAYEKSVLDSVIADVSDLKPKLGTTDAHKLDQYLTSVRELEKRLLDMGSGVVCTPGQPPPNKDNLDYQGHARAMLDLIALSFACDATRIATLMFGNAVSARTHPFLGINAGHHDISHHGQDPALVAQLAKIGAWEMDQLAYLLTKLNGLTDSVDGKTVLYNSAVFCSSDISDGDRHNHDDMPIVLGGHAGGAFTPGQHIAYPRGQGATREKVSNLLVSMLEAAGVAGAQLGDSTGPLTDL